MSAGKGEAKGGATVTSCGAESLHEVHVSFLHPRALITLDARSAQIARPGDSVCTPSCEYHEVYL